MLKSIEKKYCKSDSPRKMSKKRLQNIALYYLERFDSSAENLRQVLKRRVADYAHKIEDFDPAPAEIWIEEIVADFEHFGYINDARYADLKIEAYINAGRPERYIRAKMQQKGVDKSVVDAVLQNHEFDEDKMAAEFARKKKIGPWRSDEEARRLNRQKDLAAMVRAGFAYDTAQKVICTEIYDDTDSQVSDS